MALNKLGDAVLSIEWDGDLEICQSYLEHQKEMIDRSAVWPFHFAKWLSARGVSSRIVPTHPWYHLP